jgi:hypothetical protein
MGRLPAFQFYPSDWLADRAVGRLSLASRGIWINLLCFMSEGEPRGTITGTSEQLARMVGATITEFQTFLDEAEQTSLCDFLAHPTGHGEGGRFIHRGATVSRKPNAEPNANQTLCNRRMARDEKARQANANRQRRYYEHHKPNAECDASLTATSHASSSSSSSSISSSKKEKNSVADAPGFDEFWDKYPRKTAKKQARKAWVKLCPNAALAERIIADVGSGRWAGYEKGAIPHAATYLNNERWEDEPVAPLTNGRAKPAPRDDGPTMAEVRSRE